MMQFRLFCSLLVIGLMLVPAASARRAYDLDTEFSFQTGFENPTLEDNTGTWKIVGWSRELKNPLEWRAAEGIMNPPAFLFHWVPEGENVGWINPTNHASSGISRTTNVRLLPGFDYVLQVEIGRRTDSDGPTSYLIQVWAGSELIAEDQSSVLPAKGEWETAVLSFTTGLSSPVLGERLRIVIQNPSTCCQLNLDNIRLVAMPNTN
jgi:hypothetical protein